MKFIFVIVMALLLSSVEGSRRQRRTRRAKVAAAKREMDASINRACSYIKTKYPAETCPSYPTANYKEYTENVGVVDFWKENCAPVYKKSEKMSVLQVFGNALHFFVVIGTAYTLFYKTIR
jgi:hypothetical protein